MHARIALKIVKGIIAHYLKGRIAAVRTWPIEGVCVGGMKDR
jgi:hypothetical protein